MSNTSSATSTGGGGGSQPKSEMSGRDYLEGYLNGNNSSGSSPAPKSTTTTTPTTTTPTISSPSLASIMNPLTTLVQGMYGPQQVLLDQQLARQRDQLGLVGQNTQYQSDALRRDTSLNQQLLGLDRQGLGLDQQLVGGQLSNLGRLRDILAKQRGLTREQLDNQLGQLKVDESQLRDNAQRKTFDLRSDLTARGAFNTVANERGTGRINRDLGYGLAGINNQRTAADIQFRNSLLGLDEKGIGYDNQQLALQNKLAGIGLDYKRLDISEEKLNNALADGLYNIGFQGQTTINNLLDAMGSTNTQQAQLATTILQQIISYSNLPPDLINQLMQALNPPKAQTTVPPTREVK